MNSFGEAEISPFGARFRLSLERLVASYLDRTTLYPRTRWFSFCCFISLFVTRILFTQGFFVICYALAIYLLNLFIGFLTPQVDLEADAYVLPVREAEEYRPFQRRLPEYKFWLRGSTGTLLAIFATFIPFFDLPVYWPILLIYFMMLFFMTMKQQIKHMIKHKYVPFSWGKQTYGDITRQSGRQTKKKSLNAFGKKTGMTFPSLHVKSAALTS